MSLVYNKLYHITANNLSMRTKERINIMPKTKNIGERRSEGQVETVIDIALARGMDAVIAASSMSPGMPSLDCSMIATSSTPNQRCWPTEAVTPAGSLLLSNSFCTRTNQSVHDSSSRDSGIDTRRATTVGIRLEGLEPSSSRACERDYSSSRDGPLGKSGCD